jgi:hypothetical protein
MRNTNGGKTASIAIPATRFATYFVQPATDSIFRLDAFGGIFSKDFEFPADDTTKSKDVPLRLSTQFTHGVCHHTRAPSRCRHLDAYRPVSALIRLNRPEAMPCLALEYAKPVPQDGQHNQTKLNTAIEAE